MAALVPTGVPMKFPPMQTQSFTFFAASSGPPGRRSSSARFVRYPTVTIVKKRENLRLAIDPQTHLLRQVQRDVAPSLKAMEVPNVVTAVLASYRGYDTLGELIVIFTAGIGVLALLGYRRRDRGP